MAERLPEGLGALAGGEGRPGFADVAILLNEARKGLPKTADGWDLALAIADVAQADFLFVPARGRVLERGASEVRLLVPADYLAVGAGAILLGAGLVLALHGAAEKAGFADPVVQRRQYVNLARGTSLGMNELAVGRAALALDIPVISLDYRRNELQLGYGHRARYAHHTIVEPMSLHASYTANDKWAALALMRSFGLPTLASGLVKDADGAVGIAQRLGGPVAVKPVQGGKGKGISLGLTDPEQIRRAFAIASEGGQNVLIEKFGAGDDHRLLVVGGKMIAAARRVPATVTGDGRSSVRELIDILNADPRRGPPYEKLMDRVYVDERLETLLKRQGLSLDSVPERAQTVKVTLAANISQGGTALDVTDLVHPDNRAAAERAAQLTGTHVAGVDFLSPDIATSWRKGQGWILEVNTSPGLRPHWIASPERDVATPIVRVAIPEGNARIPLAGITGSIGKTTTCQMIAHIARAAGRHPALCTTQGTWSGDFQCSAGDSSGGGSMQRLLADPAVDIGITEIARGGLLKRGMVLDWFDVAAVLNVGGNHVGVDGIADREELAAIKSIPVRRARDWVFLLADDPLVLGMRAVMQPGAQLGLVSRDPKNRELAKHRKAGGCTVTLEGEGKKAKIVLRQGETVEFEIALAAIPVSEGGISQAIAENAMFASAIALRLGLSGKDIAKALKGFVSDRSQNPGRHNHIEGFPFELQLTWADGLPALEEMIGRLKDRPVTGKRHLYLAVPGTRSDEWTLEMGRRAAGHFDRYWCTDMDDLRGRAPLESANLIAQGLREAGVPDEAIACLDAEAKKAPHVLAQVEPGDRMTIMVYDTGVMLHDVEAYRRSLEGERGSVSG